jgi:creatinine amidohydrolase
VIGYSVGAVRKWLVVLMMSACKPEAPKDHADAGARTAPSTTAEAPAPVRVGHLLETMTWLEAKEVLTEDAVVVVPVGAASKEHGPHLQLNNDLLIADYFRDRVLEKADVVMAPTVGFHYYPAFVEYPGSITLRLETARDVIVDICTSLAAFGPKRFYVLNTGVSTVKALKPAAEVLAEAGLLMTYTDLLHTRDLVDEISEQDGGTHADEIETSMMLVIAPETVKMDAAVRDYDDSGRPGLSPRPDAGKTYSPSGVWGDATLAKREKGEKIVEARVKQMLSDIEALRRSKVR